MSKVSAPLVSAALLVLGACGDTGSQTPSEHVQGRIAGRVALEGSAAGAALSAKDGASDVDTIFAHSTADGQGGFGLELGALYGAVVIEAQTTAGDRLETWTVLPQGETRADVQVSPVTTLAAAWAAGARTRGQSRDDAWARGTALLFEHLGEVDHATVAPVDLRDAVDVVVDDGVRAGLVVHALAEQAQRWTRRGAGQGASPVTLGTLVDAYARDLADGLADGRDRFGAPVTVGAVELTPDSLRLDLSQALAAFLDGPRNGSRLRSADVRDLLRALREAEGPLFPEGSLAERDQVGPTLSLRWRRGGVTLEAGRPVAGALELAVTAADPSGVVSLTGRVVGNPVLELGAEAWADQVSWPVDTISLEDGAYEVEVEAVDGLDHVSTATTTLVVDHTAPTVVIEAAAQVATPTVAVTGRWFDASGVTQVVLRVDGETRVVLEDPTSPFEATVPLGCSGGETVTLEATATDVAGNVSSPAAADVRCVGTGPSLTLLPSSVVDERVVTFEHGPDGALLGMRTPSSPPMATLDTRAVWPVRVHKLFTWLDATSDNLPVFRWRVAGPPPLTVRYRTFVGAVAGQPWTELPVTAGGRVDLPVSYATFGAALVQHGPDAVHGAEVEVVDGEGGRVVREVSLQVETLSPPVWVGGCAPTLTPASLRLGFSAGARTALEAAQVRWDLGLRSGSLAPLGPVRLQWGRSFVVGAEITALGEEKWAPLAYTPELPSQRCRTPWGFDPVFHGVDAGPGMGLCAWGPYPAETLDAFVAGRDGRLSQTSAIAGVFDVLRASTPLAPDGQGRFSLEPSTAYGVTVSAEQPSLRLPDGGPYTWPTQITVPEGYVSTVQAQGRARYPVAAFERRGREHRSRVTEGRPFVTRTFVQRVQVDVPPLQAEAELPTLGIEVPVTFDAACSAPLILEVQL